MQSKRVHCIQHSEERRSWEITPEGRVWPCCYFGNAWDRKGEVNEHGWCQSASSRMLLEDDRFKEIMAEDPDWNNLEKHSLDDITSHKYYWNEIWLDGFKNNPHPICQRECYVVVDEGTGKTRSKSDIMIFDDREDV